MRYIRTRVIWNAARYYCERNKKYIICFSLVLLLGLIVGIVSEINACNGEFERIYNQDIVYGSVKVFFISSLYLLIGYFIIFIGGANKKFCFLILVPIFLSGLFWGRYMCLLTACYGTIGLLNLFIIYIPFFLIQFVCISMGAIDAFSRCGIGGDYSAAKRLNVAPTLVIALKWYGINVAIDFVVFFIFGIFVKVIVVI